MLKELLPSLSRVAYAANYHATYRRNVALVIDKIFKGTKPGDLPVQQPTEFELILISRLPRRSASKCRRRCSPAPTR